MLLYIIVFVLSQKKVSEQASDIFQSQNTGSLQKINKVLLVQNSEKARESQGAVLY